MTDRVENRLVKREARRIGHTGPRSVTYLILHGPVDSHLKRRTRQIYQHDIAARLFSHVEPGPSATCSDIQQAMARAQFE